MEEALEKQLDALAQLDELKREAVELWTTRTSNTTHLKAARTDNTKQLKSDLKKSTAFVKKLRAVTTDGLLNCIKDTETLNLNLYISEIVTALLETSFKVADIPNIVRLCSCLHRQYEEFTSPLIHGLMESLLSPDSGDKEEMKRKRIQLRFSIELFQDGVLADDELIVKLFRKITCRAKGSNTANQQIDLISLTSFVKFGSETIFGFMSKKMTSLCDTAGKPAADYPLKVVASTGTQNELKMLLSEVYEQLCTATVSAHKDMVSKEKRFEKDRVLHGQLSEAKQTELDNAKRLFEKLISAVTSISECTGDPLPVLQVDKESVDSSKGISVWEGSTALGDYGPYEDAESKSFYEDLPDLLAMVPLAALGLTPEQAAALREQWNVVDDKAVDEDDTVDESLLGGNDNDEVKDESVEKASESEKASGDIVEDTPQVRVAALLDEKLPEATSKQKATDFCVSFCYLNSKIARKKLVAALLKINRNRYELFGTYSRIIASLNRLFPQDVAPPILEDLQRHFFGSFKAKSQFYIESKIKVVRYVGELVKFKVAPPIMAFKMMKLLLSDLTRHNVELLTSLLETCGRYLYLLPATQEKMQETLVTMLRLRSIKNLDLHQQAMIEAAYFTVKPPERVQRVKKELTPLQKYIRYLLSTRLDMCMRASSTKESKESVDELIKSIRKLPWSDPHANVDVEVIKASLKTARKKYVNIPILADCISGLSAYRPNFTCRLVDVVLEEIQHEVEEPHKRVQQRTIGLVKLIGELYNYTTLNSVVIFDLLHALVKYVNPESAKSEMHSFVSKIGGDNDSSSDNFRIQLVAELLNTTGGYYVSGNAKEKLIKFLAVFQRFLLNRPGLPMHVEFCVLDLFDRLELLAREAAIKKARKANPKKKLQDIEDSVRGGPYFPRFDTLEAVDATIAEFESRDDGKRDDDVRENADDDEESDFIAKDEDSNDDDEDDESGDNSDSDESEENGELSTLEASRMLEKMRIAEEEDEEFEKAFRGVMQDSLEGASKSMGGFKAVDVNMARPAILPKPKNVFARFDNGEDEDTDEAAAIKSIPFKLLSRDNRGRLESRQLLVPEDSQMSIKLAKAEAAKREEKDRLKQLVLLRDEADDESNDDIGNPPAVLEPRRVVASNIGGRGRGRGYQSRDASRYTDRTTGSDMGLSDFLAESNASDVKKLQHRIQGESGGRGAGRGGRGPN